MSISDHHEQQILLPRGLTAAQAEGFGVRSIRDTEHLLEVAPEFTGNRYATGSGLLFVWNSPLAGEVRQFRPDDPQPNSQGDLVKYVFQSGQQMVLNQLRLNPDGPLLAQEGTMQSLCGAVYAHEGWSVVGISGCWSWRSGETQVATPDLMVVDGRDVVISLDADAGTNLNVYNAGLELKDAMLAEGAHSVNFLWLQGAGAKAGLDDVLGSRPVERRADYLRRALEHPEEKPAKARPAKRGSGGGKAAHPFIDSAAGGLQVVKLADAVSEAAPMLLTQEDRIAVYTGGVFRTDGTAVIAALGDLLGEHYRKQHRATVEEFLVGRLARTGARAPMHASEALLNVANGMLDLATGTLKPHDPSYLSTAQLPVEWDPEATCPTYEAWLVACVEDQADDLEEVAAQMLDPSRTPAKAAFLFGPSRSGKSTFIRLMEAVAGPDNTSAVTLHQLVGDRFAAANVYGKILNAAADLSSAAVDDLSIFKLMTGDDSIQANRKYGSQFAFRNRALFAFSANDPPTVGESSRAYIERIKPVWFGSSFAGREDPALESAMLTELPGILARWVRAWQRRSERGTWLPTRPDVLHEFETRSDRVRQWVSENLIVTEVQGQAVPRGGGMTRRDLARTFNRWAEDSNGSRMGERKIIDRLLHIPGVIDGREEGTKSRVLNLRLRTGSDEVAEVAVSTHPTPDVGSQKHRIIECGEVESSIGQGGSKLPLLPPSGGVYPGYPNYPSTVGADPLSSLLPLLQPVPPRECPDCEQAEELTPSGLWMACKSCHPGSFTPRS